MSQNPLPRLFTVPDTRTHNSASLFSLSRTPFPIPRSILHLFQVLLQHTLAVRTSLTTSCSSSAYFSYGTDTYLLHFTTDTMTVAPPSARLKAGWALVLAFLSSAAVPGIWLEHNHQTRNYIVLPSQRVTTKNMWIRISSNTTSRPTK